MKAFTDISQSRKLAEILPLESADMDYIPVVNIDGEYSIVVNVWDNDHVIEEGWIPCWSLAALLGVLPYPTLHQQGDGVWGVDAWVERVKPYSVNNAICEVDACYEMIIKLKEDNLL